ncbi:MAG: hypothetical protein WD939_05270 [Dehalococcoidia bacterium]
MKASARSVAEALARTTTRRGLFGRGADVAFGALIGAAAGTATRATGAYAGAFTVCIFPGPPCPCDGCSAAGTCAKPCIFNQCCYASGCWVAGDVTCCDCDCNGLEDIGVCGCGSDYHNNLDFCTANASGPV